MVKSKNNIQKIYNSIILIKKGEMYGILCLMICSLI